MVSFIYKVLNILGQSTNQLWKLKCSWALAISLSIWLNIWKKLYNFKVRYLVKVFIVLPIYKQELLMSLEVEGEV